MPQSEISASPAERRSLTGHRLSELTEATHATIARSESLLLSDRDRAAFFDALIHPPEPNARLRRAFRLAERRVVA
jgi:uncharacterized protein (DUF1778 family)